MSFMGVPFEEYMREDKAYNLTLFFFHADTLQKYSWTDIKEKNLYLQRYGLRPADMRVLGGDNVVIPFPPDPAMRYMRMTPPYGTYESLLKDSINQTNR